MRKNLFNFVASGVAFLMVAACADPSLQGLDQPSDSTVTVTQDYPSVVMIILPLGVGMCTGTFVSPRAVLTAAHCTLGDGNYTVVTSFGNFRTTTHLNLGSGTVADTSDISLLLFDTDVAQKDLGQVSPLGAAVARLDRVRLVGFGCNDIDTKSGAGTKRTGTNQVAAVDNYIELKTPRSLASTTTTASRGILGASNRAGSCFGDSGGPLFLTSDSPLSVVGVVHAGGPEGNLLVSQYTNLLSPVNRNFLVDADQQYHLSIFDACDGHPESCGSSSASVQIASFLKWIWGKSLLVIWRGWKLLF